MLMGDRSKLVMSFERMGMHGAQPLFRDEHCVMQPGGRANLYSFPDAHLIANAPTYIADLLAEVDRLREEARAFAEALGFGDGRNEPAATLAQMIDPLAEDRATAAEHIECAVMCESCGEVLAADRCEECHGSGCLPNAELAYLECGTCAGVGRIHVGCAEASYAGLAARAEAAEQAVERVRELAEYWSVSGNSWRKAAARQFLHALDGGDR